MQKLYCYVDESGQDSGSRHFVVVAVVSEGDQETFRKEIIDIENSVGAKKKWHKLRHSNRMAYLDLALEKKIASGDVFCAYYKKPIPYLFPLVHLVEKAIAQSATGPYSANVYVDGIDKRGAKSRRDESEPLIRLADMWAGCLRSALLKHKDAQSIIRRAKKEKYLIDLTS